MARFPSTGGVSGHDSGILNDPLLNDPQEGEPVDVCRLGVGWNVTVRSPRILVANGYPEHVTRYIGPDAFKSGWSPSEYGEPEPVDLRWIEAIAMFEVANPQPQPVAQLRNPLARERREPETATDDRDADGEQWWADSLDLDNLPPPPLPLMVRDDGEPLLVAGVQTVVFGPGDMCKSWVAQAATHSVIDQSGRVLWWDWERTQRATEERLRQLGVSDVQRADQWRYVPAAKLGDRDMPGAVAWVSGGDGPGVVVIDSVNAAGGGLNQDSEYIEWLDRMVKPFLRAGAAVILLDHPTKNRNPDARWEGPKNAGAKYQDATLVFEVVGHPWGRQHAGHVNLIKREDNDDLLPHVRKNQPAAAMTVSYPDGRFTWAITEPVQQQTPAARDPQDLEDELLTALAAQPSGTVPSQRQLCQLVKGRNNDLKLAAENLIHAGLVAKSGNGRGWRYTVTEKARDMLDMPVQGRIEDGQ